MIGFSEVNEGLSVSKKQKLPDLETSLTEIHSLIEQMEKGGLSLEHSLTHFERGMTLIHHAQTILQTAEQKVRLLTETKEGDQLTDYENNET